MHLKAISSLFFYLLAFQFGTIPLLFCFFRCEFALYFYQTFLRCRFPVIFGGRAFIGARAFEDTCGETRCSV